MEATVTCNLCARVCGCVVSVRTLALSCFLQCVFLPSHAHAHARRIHFITPSSSPCVVSSLFHTHTTWLTLRVTGHTPCACERCQDGNYVGTTYHVSCKPSRTHQGAVYTCTAPGVPCTASRPASQPARVRGAFVSCRLAAKIRKFRSKRIP